MSTYITQCRHDIRRTPLVVWLPRPALTAICALSNLCKNYDNEYGDETLSEIICLISQSCLFATFYLFPWHVHLLIYSVYASNIHALRQHAEWMCIVENVIASIFIRQIIRSPALHSNTFSYQLVYGNVVWVSQRHNFYHISLFLIRITVHVAKPAASCHQPLTRRPFSSYKLKL